MTAHVRSIIDEYLETTKTMTPRTRAALDAEIRELLYKFRTSLRITNSEWQERMTASVFDEEDV